jgi:hypothetical protein
METSWNGWNYSGLTIGLPAFSPGEDAALQVADVGESEFDEGGGGFRAAAAAAAVNQQRLARIEFFRRAGGEILEILPLPSQRLRRP